MPLQTRNLVMTALGVQRDTPPNWMQPPLLDGIHLRWAFQTDLGFPLHGFYLFRRPSLAGSPVCVGQSLQGLQAGRWPTETLPTPVGQFRSDSPLLLTDEFPPVGTVELDLDSRSHLRFDLPPGEPGRLIEVKIAFRSSATLDVVGLLWDVPVIRVQAQGGPRQIVTVSIEFDAITSVELGSGPAALIDICVVPVSQEERKCWKLISGFPYPLRLPLTHPDYPPSQGSPEDFSTARITAAERVRYGDQAEFSALPTPQAAQGTVAVTNGSPIVKGTDTNWGEELISGTLEVSGDTTAYTIISVLAAPDRLVLSRNYSGPTRSGEAYAISQDAFGLFYDDLVQLVSGNNALPMTQRFFPIPIYSAGAIGVRGDESTITGYNGANWTSDFEGLALQIREQTTGVIASINGSIVVGIGTNWLESQVGLTLQIEGQKREYTIKRVDSGAQILEIDRSYVGPDPAGRSFRIVEKTPYSIKSVDSNMHLTLDRAYARNTGDIGVQKNYDIVGRLQPSRRGKVAPLMSRQYPLDFVLLAGTNPAIAQILGLYWVDSTAPPDVGFDYMILADRDGSFARAAGNDPFTIQNWLDHGFPGDWDRFIVFNRLVSPAQPLATPDDIRVYALPGGTIPAERCVVEDASNNAGLRWTRGISDLGLLLPGQPLMYHLWRTYLGNDVSPAQPSNYAVITKGRPILLAEPRLDSGNTVLAQFPSDWPAFPMHAIDSGLVDGWYSYEVSGIDIFGRHSPNSDASRWFDFQELHPFAIQLLDKIPPPPPAALEAYALDPRDPTLLKDAAYNDWFQSLSEDERQNVIGLRVRWLWPHTHIRQAPDTREFRVYYQPGQLNALVGRTTSVTTSTITESLVVTDIPNTLPADTFKGASLQIGSDVFPVTANEPSTPLQLAVRSGPSITDGSVAVENGSPVVTGSSTNWLTSVAGFAFSVSGETRGYTVLRVDVQRQQITLDRKYAGMSGAGKPYTLVGKLPRANAPCTLTLPQPYDVGTVSISGGSATVVGSGMQWTADLTGYIFELVGDPTPYTVVGVDSSDFITLDRPYVGVGGVLRTYLIRHPLYVDYTASIGWQERSYVVGFDENVTESTIVLEDSAQRELSGASAVVTGNVVTLDGLPDLSDLRLSGELLQLDNDVAGPTTAYCIVGVDNDNKTITVDGNPNVRGSPSPWSIVVPIRTYELFIPAPVDSLRVGLPLTPSLAEPIVYAHIGVTAVDDKLHTADDPKWSPGRWGGRHGNESIVAGPAKIFRVLRDVPRAPEPPPDSERVYASLPDYHSHSFYTYRWQPLPYLKTHIHRALDDTLFQVDWSLRCTQPPRSPLDSSQDDFFPKAEIEPRWDVLKRQQVTDELNALDRFSKDAVGRTQAMKYYRTLSNDGLRVLAGLPGNEHAFSQITIWPLDSQERDPEDTALLRWRNRPGPDDPYTFRIGDSENPLASPGLSAYIDALDGRATNRYFYRSSYVDGAHNRSPLSLSSPPIWLRDVVPPRAPVFSRVLGGDRQITLKWASNREQNLAEYRVYRTENGKNARDLRLMTLVHAEPAPSSDPADRPAEVSWTDAVPGLVTFYYRLVAVDEVGNASTPSAVVTARAFDTTLPVPPALTVGWVARGGQTRAQIEWMSDDETLLQRREPGGPWVDLAQWRPSGQVTVRDPFSEPAKSYEYRVRVRKYTGATALGPTVPLQAQGD